MRNKKGQMTLFIILGIIVVVGGLVYFLFRDEINLKGSGLDVENINTFVINCIEKTGEETIFELGKNGGYFVSPSPNIYPNIPLYYFNKTNNMISKERLEKEISFLMEQKLFFCTKNFVDFQNFEINQQEISIETSIKDEEVIFDVNYPLTIKKGNETVNLNNFEVSLFSKLGTIYNAVDSFIEEQIKQDAICLNCLLEISLINDLYVRMSDYDRETTIFIFEDKNYKKGEETFKYVFANKYGEKNEN